MKTTCPTCKREVPANMDGTPKRHRPGRYAMSGDIPCPGGVYDLRPILFSDPMVTALLLGLKRSTIRRSPMWDRLQVGDRLYVCEVWAEGEDVVYFDENRQNPRVGKPLYYRADAELEDYSGPWLSSMRMPYAVHRLTLEVTSRTQQIIPAYLTGSQIVSEGIRVLPLLKRLPEKRRPWWDLARMHYAQGDLERAFCDLWAAVNGPEDDMSQPAWLISFRLGVQNG